IPIRERVERLSIRLAELRPGHREAMRTLALAHKKLGALYAVTKRFEEARGQYQEAAAIDERNLAATPDDTRAKIGLSYDYSDLGGVAGQMGDHTGAAAAHRHVLALRTEAAAADPNDQRAANSMAAALVRVGTSLRKAGDLEGSEREIRR